MDDGLSDKNKREIRKLLRSEFGGKSFGVEAYLLWVKSVAEKCGVDGGKLEEFLNSYTLKVDGEIKIFGKKVAGGKKKVGEVVEEPVAVVQKKMMKVTRTVIRKVLRPKVKSSGGAEESERKDIYAEYAQYNQPLPEGVHIVQAPVVQSVVQVQSAAAARPTRYVYPNEVIAARIHRESKYGPHGTQWINDIQVDDVITKEIEARQVAVKKLLDIKVPEQRSPGWFEMREKRITASDGGCVLGVNDYEPKYKFILKKVVGSEFKGNEFCYHGKKYEKAAIMVYEYRFNVGLSEFGLIGHPTIGFLGASPDGIVGLYKNDGQHFTKYVGRMLEIKCPFRRKIEMEGGVDDIVPIYYQVQVQLQLECCDLDECDFWQCKITEYVSRSEFVNDTDPQEQFRSRVTGFEKGCLIQLLPKGKMKEILETGKYWDNVYDDAIFVYPPKIEMTPCDCDIWISKTVGSLHLTHAGFVFDKVIYWKLERSHCLLIERDKKWFAEKLPELQYMWGMVEFFRSNKRMRDLLVQYVASLSIKTSKKIMKVVDMLAKVPGVGTAEEIIYNEYVKRLMEEIAFNNIVKAEKIAQKTAVQKEDDSGSGVNNGAYMF
ncbi:MAG: YqaJ-like viral recombinase domain [Hyperionvirus sp.]|uniref:YqaJ-like viral recombinase domain n=1 Tax=Hyperionvirus sp. TaxID=2487770 RepID=A0A3G5AAL3_9VIRU|nr:MAG: YqaJ-like viral recombinase domain [Hyperionvirus sp.]